MIELDGVSVRFGEQLALDRVSARVGQGEFVLVTGSSGCGKSTLTRCLNGLIPHAIAATLTGEVLVGGVATRDWTVSDLARSVGLVFQNPAAQLFCLTVGEEVEFGPRNLGWADQRIDAERERVLDALGISALRHRHLQTLSGGELQRVAIASVLAMKPSVLVLDEPTSHLDSHGRAGLLATLDRLGADGLTTIVVEHRIGEVARRAPRTIVMDQGRIEADGATEAIFTRRDLLRRLGLRRPTDEEESDWRRLVTSRTSHDGTPVVELRGVEAGYGPRQVLDRIDLAIHEGEFIALVGDNGCGKTTLARVLAGLLRPRGGSIRWRGDHVRPGRDTGLLFQDPSAQLFCDTVGDEVAFGPRRFGSFEQAELDAALETHGLAGLAGRTVRRLSVGQQQRTALAAVLSLRPRLVILDEPTLGQDWRNLSRFMDHLVALNREGCTVVVISHDYKLVHRYATRILVLDQGRIVADGAPAGPHRGSDAEAMDAVLDA